MTDVGALIPVIVLLAAGLTAIVLGRITGVSAIVGFLLAGVLVGEHGLNLVHESETTHLLAELGVVFLLFDIGLHFSVREIGRARADLTGLAPAQFVLCAVPFVIIARLFGLDWPLAIILGCALSLSSTAVVSRLLAESGRTTCPLGRSATAVLIFQDVAAIFLLVYAGSLEAGGSLALAAGAAALKAGAAAAIAIALGRLIAVPAFRTLAATRNDEAFPAAALLIVLATAAATGAIGLSLTLGAFLAGMIIADTPYRALVQTEARAFRALLMGFFFMSVGMAIDVESLLVPQTLTTVIAGAALILVVKTALVIVAARLSGWSKPGSVQLGFLIAQGSEFALVIAALPAVATGAPAGALDALAAMIALTLALTPAWSELGMRAARAMASAAARTAAEPAAPSAPVGGPGAPVVVFGMTPAGRYMIDVLSRLDLAAIAIDEDPVRHAAAHADGYRPILGAGGDMRFVATVGADRAQAVVLGAPNLARSQGLTDYLRETWPSLKRFAAVQSHDEVAAFAATGVAAFVVGPDQGSPRALAEAVLTAIGVPEAQQEAAFAELEAPSRAIIAAA